MQKKGPQRARDGGKDPAAFCSALAEVVAVELLPCCAVGGRAWGNHLLAWAGGRRKPRAAHFCQAAALPSSVTVLPWPGTENPGSCQQVTVLPSSFAALSPGLAVAEMEMEEMEAARAVWLGKQGAKEKQVTSKVCSFRKAQ